MIELTRLNGHPLLVNPELIKLAEAAPDTMLTLVTGDKLVVRESCAELAERMLHYRVSVLRACGGHCNTGCNLAPVEAVAAAGARHAHTTAHQ